MSNINKLTTRISWENVDDVNNFSVADLIVGWIHIFPFCCDRCQGVYLDADGLFNHKRVYLVRFRIRFLTPFCCEKNLFSSINRTP